MREHVALREMSRAGLEAGRANAEAGFRVRGLYHVELWRPKPINLAVVQDLRSLAGESLARGAEELAKVYTRRANDLLSLEWEERGHNLITTVGETEFLEQFFNGSAYTATHYVGLKDTGSAAVGNTMSSHAGWSEITPYSDGTRPAYNPDAASAGSISNATNKATFSINATDTVYGYFLTTNSTKSGTTGVLISVADFASSRDVESGDTLRVQITYTI